MCHFFHDRRVLHLLHGPVPGHRTVRVPALPSQSPRLPASQPENLALARGAFGRSDQQQWLHVHRPDRFLLFGRAALHLAGAGNDRRRFCRLILHPSPVARRHGRGAGRDLCRHPEPLEWHGLPNVSPSGRIRVFDFSFHVCGGPTRCWRQGPARLVRLGRVCRDPDRRGNRGKLLLGRGNPGLHLDGCPAVYRHDGGDAHAARGGARFRWRDFCRLGCAGCSLAHAYEPDSLGSGSRLAGAITVRPRLGCRGILRSRATAHHGAIHDAGPPGKHQQGTRLLLRLEPPVRPGGQCGRPADPNSPAPRRCIRCRVGIADRGARSASGNSGGSRDRWNVCRHPLHGRLADPELCSKSDR